MGVDFMHVITVGEFNVTRLDGFEIQVAANANPTNVDQSVLLHCALVKFYVNKIN